MDEEARERVLEAANDLAYQIDRLITDRITWAAENPHAETYDDLGVEARKRLVAQAIIGVMVKVRDVERYLDSGESAA